MRPDEELKGFVDRLAFSMEDGLHKDIEGCEPVNDIEVRKKCSQKTGTSRSIAFIPSATKVP